MSVRHKYDNGRGASVAITGGTYEVAVVAYGPEFMGGSRLDYSTPITSDVVRVGNEYALIDVLEQIRALPPRRMHTPTTRPTTYEEITQ